VCETVGAGSDARVDARYGADMTTFLIGGGWTAAARPLLYGPFLEDAGANPVVACIVLDEGDGWAQFDRWADALLATAPCEPVAALVPLGDRFDVRALGTADAVLVCGGLTPAYADALAPAADGLAEWLAAGSRPYAGFSAGAALAAGSALVGGWRVDGVPVCPEDAGEDLDEVTVVPGLGLVPLAVDVHAAQWGTVNRMAAAVRGGWIAAGLAIDEDTMIAVAGRSARVAGLGQVHGIAPASGHGRADGRVVEVRTWRAGEVIDLEHWPSSP
jgi:cyanophycinase